MRKLKAIAALCAMSLTLSTMAMPVQAKTSKAETKVTTTATSADMPAKPKSKAAIKEFKDFGKDLKATIHTYDDLEGAYMYATMMCASSLTVTMASDYGDGSMFARGELDHTDTYIRRWVGHDALRVFSDWDTDKPRTVATGYDFGDVWGYFTYAYRTGDTSVIDKKHQEFYDLISSGVDFSLEDAESVEDIALNVCKWLKANTEYNTRSVHLGWDNNYRINYNADGKIYAMCDGYSGIFTLMMRMAGCEAWRVTGFSPKNNDHAWNAVKIGDEYRYYDSCWTVANMKYANMTYKQMLKLGYVPHICYSPYKESPVPCTELDNPTQQQLEATFRDWKI